MQGMVEGIATRVRALEEEIRTRDKVTISYSLASSRTRTALLFLVQPDASGFEGFSSDGRWATAATAEQVNRATAPSSTTSALGRTCSPVESWGLSHPGTCLVSQAPTGRKGERREPDQDRGSETN